MKESNSRSHAGQRFVEFVLVPIAPGLFFLLGIFPLLVLHRDLDKGFACLHQRLSQVKIFEPYFKQEKPAAFQQRKMLRGVETAQALLEVQQKVVQAGVQIERITLQGNSGKEKEPRYAVTPFELSFSCPESAFMEFLKGVRQLGFLCRIESFRIRADQAQGSRVAGQVRLAKIDILGRLNEAKPLAPSAEKTQPQSGPGRDLFRAPFIARPKIIQVSSESQKDIVGNLALVGIINDGTPKAAIEDKKTSRSYFLASGDMLGEMKVLEIKENEVVLEKDNVQYSLMM